MTRKSQTPTRLFGVALLAVALVLAGLALSISQPASVQAAEGVPAPVSQGGEVTNEVCLACHQRPDQAIELSNGDALDISVDPEAYLTSVHGAQEMSCTQCHTNITGYPHPPIEAQSRREYSLQFQQTCKNCHTEQFEANQDSMHADLLAQGNLNAPTCASCHDPHIQGKITGDDGQLLTEAKVWVAETCATCHSAIFQEYAESVHGAGIIEGQSVSDSPTCTTCHGVHSIPDPNTAEFRINSPKICADCHTDETIMAKYGLSTNVLDTYVADFHGTTVTLFQKQHPDQETNAPVCFDCHGVHNIIAVDDPQKGIAVKDNMLAACQRCHPGANINFPDSWLSHYIPSPDRYPLVYWVQMFYTILIPLVIGAMALFVLTDIYRIIRTRGKKNTPPPTENTTGTA